MRWIRLRWSQSCAEIDRALKSISRWNRSRAEINIALNSPCTVELVTRKFLESVKQQSRLKQYWTKYAVQVWIIFFENLLFEWCSCLRLSIRSEWKCSFFVIPFVVFFFCSFRAKHERITGAHSRRSPRAPTTLDTPLIRSTAKNGSVYDGQRSCTIYTEAVKRLKHCTDMDRCCW